MKFLSLCLVLALATGCTSVSSRTATPLDKFQRIFVEERLNDNNRVAQLLVAELRRLGRDASSGPLTMLPERTDAVLTYDARWAWDFKTYLIELNIELHTPISNKALAVGRYYQPSVRPESPERVIHDLLERWFPK